MARARAVVTADEHVERAAASRVTMTIDRGRLVVLLAFAGIAILSCLVAEPNADLPRPVATRPHIIRSSVVPPAGAILGSFPAKFVVPVELSDPTLTFDYAGFLD